MNLCSRCLSCYEKFKTIIETGSNYMQQRGRNRGQTSDAACNNPPSNISVKEPEPVRVLVQI